MHDELGYLGLAPLFGAAGAMATVAAWHLYAVLFMEMVPTQLALLVCLLVGLAGPTVVLSIVWTATRSGGNPVASAVRRSATLGLGLVVAAELGFYIPLGFFAIAFQSPS